MTPNQNVTQYSVPVKNTPGQLHKIAKLLAKEQVNIIGITSETISDVGYVRFLAERSVTVKKIMEGQGFQVFETPAFCVALPNRPGELARLTEVLEENGVNIETIYGTANGGEHSRLILTVNRPEKAEKLLAQFANGLIIAAR